MSVMLIMEDVAIYVIILLVHFTVIVRKVIDWIQMENIVLVGYTKVIFSNCI